MPHSFFGFQGYNNGHVKFLWLTGSTKIFYQGIRFLGYMECGRGWPESRLTENGAFLARQVSAYTLEVNLYLYYTVNHDRKIHTEKTK